MQKAVAGFFLIIVVFCFCGTTASAGLMLSGASVITSNDNGGAVLQHFWNTHPGPDFGNAANLWVIHSNNLNGDFINGPNNDDARILVPLTDGNHTFSFFGNGGGESQGYWSMNLFFDGDDFSPGISVFAPTDTSAIGLNPEFSATGSLTRSLDLNDAASPGGLSYTSGMTTVTLTDFRWSLPTVDNLNRVDYRTIHPTEFHELPDYTGQITLQVSTVPEPSSIVLFVFGGCLCLVSSLGSAERKCEPLA